MKEILIQDSNYSNDNDTNEHNNGLWARGVNEVLLWLE